MNSTCHTGWGHLFHPNCDSLSESSQFYYSLGGTLLKISTLNISHLLHAHLNQCSSPRLLQVGDYVTLDSIREKVKDKIEGYETKDLVSLHAEELEKFQKLLLEHGNHPWKEENVQQQFDLTLSLALLAGFEMLKEVSETASPSSILTDQTFPYYKVFFLVPTLYEFARGCCTYKQRGESIMFTYLKADYAENKELFYQQGTIQEQWRETYNLYCRFVYRMFDRKALEENDERFVLHTQEDLNPCEYQWNVGTIPS